MSQENVEIVREQFEATNRRDFERPMSAFADDVELVTFDEVLLAGTYSGRDAVVQFFVDWFSAFGADIHFDLQELRDAGDAVVVWARQQATGRHSGIELVGDFFYAFRLRDGKIVRIEFHPTWAQALESVGISE